MLAGRRPAVLILERRPCRRKKRGARGANPVGRWQLSLRIDILSVPDMLAEAFAASVWLPIIAVAGSVLAGYQFAQGRGSTDLEPIS